MTRFIHWNAAARTVVFLSIAMLIAGVSVAKAVYGGEEKPSENAANPQKEESKPAHPLRASLDSGRDVAEFLYLETEIVRRELELTDAQKEKIAPLLKELRAWTPWAKSDKKEEARGVFVKQFEAVLNARQIDRLLQIATQTAWMIEFALNDETGKVFDLTDDQKAKLKAISHDAMKALSKVNTGLYSTRETTPDDLKNQQRAIFGRELRIRKEADEKFEKILMWGQLATLYRMKGKEFDVEKLHDEILDASLRTMQFASPNKQPPPANEAKSGQPAPSSQQKAEKDRERTAAAGKKMWHWQMVFDLDVSGLPSLEPVQFAMFDEDPIPAFMAEVKRMRPIREKLPQSNSDSLRDADIVISWNAGFKKITGDMVGVLRNGAPHPAGGFGAAAKKWVVTKAVTMKGKPVCWSVPIEPKPVDQNTAQIESVDLNEKTMIDLQALFDKAMREADKSND
jgi:hypothetical protein